jgi:hypothetical protein
MPPTSRMRPGLGEGPAHLAGRERRYLGCVRLQLSAIYQTGVLEGCFKVGQLHACCLLPCALRGHTCRPPLACPRLANPCGMCR